MKLTLAQLQHVLDTYDSGVLSSGSHRADEGAYCALEAVSLARNNGRDNFTDSPSAVGMPDLRPINDAPWSSDEARTKALLPLISALSDWSEWSAARQQKWVEYVAIQTVVQIVSALPGLSIPRQQACRQADTLNKAAAAAWATVAAEEAEAAAVWAAAEAAAAAWAAAAWATVAAEEAADSTLLTAINIWLSAVSESEAHL